MTSTTVTRWSRALVAAGVAAVVPWQAAALAGVGRPTTVVLGLYGFVFPIVFGKAYALVPSYFARELAFPRAPAVHLPLAVGGAALLAADAAGIGPDAAGFAGATLWLLGCLVFVAALGWTVRDNLTGRETGTGDANAHRRRIDRAANAAVPVVLAYLLVGAALPVLDAVDLAPPFLPAAGPARTHVLAAGTAALLVFAVGFRLLPRFLVAATRPALAAVVLPAGAVAPALLAGDFLGGTPFRAGAALQALAVVGFAVAYVDLYRRSDRRRVGFHAVLAAVACGAGAVAIGLHVAFAGFEPGLVDAHYRLALTGFLGLTIVGVSVQFYPPSIGSAPGVGDRTAFAAIGALAGGLAVEVVGHLAGYPEAVVAGRAGTFAGACAYAYVVLALFVERR